MEEGQKEGQVAPITVSEFRDVGLCVKGQRRFAKDHGMDFADYIANGLPYEVAMRVNPASTKLVLEMRAARERTNEQKE